MMPSVCVDRSAAHLLRGLLLLLLRRIQFDKFLPIGLRRRCPPAARWVIGERCMLLAVGARFVPRGVAAIEIFVPIELGDRPATISVAQFLYRQHQVVDLPSSEKRGDRAEPCWVGDWGRPVLRQFRQ
jgi:hypothetical protein